MTPAQILTTASWLLRSRFAMIVCLLAISAPGWCDEDMDSEDVSADEAAQTPAPPEVQGAVHTGYRFVTPVNTPTALAPYLRKKSGATGGFSVGSVNGDLKLAADGQFLHEDDYHAGLILDYAGLYRLRLDTATLWHNQEHLPLTPGLLTAIDQNKDAEFGIRTNISQMDNRIRLGNYPAHLNLGYWELSREGVMQSRLSDFAFDGNPGSIISQAIRVDTVTREANLGLDAYLGPVSAAYSFVIRDFSNNAPDPVYNYNARDGFSGGSLPHDTTADCRVITNTLSLTSDQSGGLAAGAIYSITRREITTDRGDAHPLSRPSDTLQSVAGDLSYTPFKELSLALKYRRLEIARDTPAAIFSPSSLLPATPTPVYTATPGLLLVRPSSDTIKDTLSLSAAWRPVPKAVYKLEYQAELESRSNLPDPSNNDNPAILRTDSRQTHTVRASFLWRPINAVRLNTSYSFATCDNPAYLAAFSERHTGQALLSYSASGLWGITANYQGVFDTANNSSGNTALPRQSATTTVGSTFWFSPMERLTLTTGYAYFRTAVDQNSLVNDQFPLTSVLTMANRYRSHTHNYNLDAVLAASDTIDLSLSFQQIFADTRYSTSDNSGSSTGVGDASRLVSTETGLTARADWRLTRHLGCTLSYSFKDLVSGNPLYDGSMHETMLAVTGRW